jgi:low temperature requirement protein LtrA
VSVDEEERRASAATVDAEERRVSPIELLWDLVFVFAITQVTTLLRSHLTWGGFGEAMVALALVWWAWSAFVWAVNAEEDNSSAVRLSLLAGMGALVALGWLGSGLHALTVAALAIAVLAALTAVEARRR